MSEHELDWGIDLLATRLIEAEDHLVKRQKDYDIAVENLEYAKDEVRGLKVAIAALESLKPEVAQCTSSA